MKYNLYVILFHKFKYTSGCDDDDCDDDDDDDYEYSDGISETAEVTNADSDEDGGW